MSTSSAADEILIRRAEAQDCDQVFKLMQELAKHLKCEKDMKLTKPQFYKDAFGENPVIFGFVATTQAYPSTVIGFTLYFNCYNFLDGFALSMENLYVSPAHRRKGIGKMLWKEVAKKCLELDGAGILICTDGWNKESRDFYFRHGCVDLLETRDQRYMNMERAAMEAFAKEK